ncbi:MAG: phospho-sugar mutase [Micrococcales bacterium]|nr:phospho-sugar mutase [Micrococcales bacterium]
MDLAAEVAAWVVDDPDPATADELSGLLAAWQGGDEVAGADLASRFAGPLEFGTAGLRGARGGGPARMNRAVVIRAAAGLVAYLHSEIAEEHDESPPQDGGHGRPGAPRVVVGYDARHGSRTFALDSAAVLTGAGAQVMVLPGPLPTPVLAFAVRHLDTDAGVMVTASHNPATDNGYKVYLGGRVVTDEGRGAQIVPPADATIAHEIARVPSVASVPRAAEGWTVLGPEVVHAYETAALTVARPEPARAANLRVVLTALHGVGAEVASRVLSAAGFTDLHVVAEQAEPDPDFPTVAFPNPEEPGVLDLALAAARRLDADLVVALDPDADRCALAVPDPHLGGAWRLLHGDETGALLGSAAAEAHASSSPDRHPVLACSVVSSRLLGRIAAASGLGFVQTLTGFKWITRAPGMVFGYEEALGCCVDPAHVRDKDGITAALLAATLAADLHAQGRTLVDRLDDLARAHGLYLTDQLAARFADPSGMSALVDRLRSEPPATLAGSPVIETTDLAHGSPTLPPTDGIVLRCADDTRVVVRPSGTEPKIKCYLEVVHPVPLGADLTTLRGQAREHLAAVASDLRPALEPAEH